ncbi:hypothetical protein H2203_007173 [Taxawa tesnikishii (nom. ined.)]|nr:hypothetical protein H2203_007173 [Dothideales sp. JES 119]
MLLPTGHERPRLWVQTKLQEENFLYKLDAPAPWAKEQTSYTSLSPSNTTVPTTPSRASSHSPRTSSDSVSHSQHSSPTLTPTPTPTGSPTMRVKVRSMPKKRRPTLRRCSISTNESLRDIRQKQSEACLRDLYEAQTMAYLNDAIPLGSPSPRESFTIPE